MIPCLSPSCATTTERRQSPIQSIQRIRGFIKRSQRSIVFDHVICNRKPLRARRLRGDHSIGQCGIDAVARQQARALQFHRNVDHHDAIEPWIGRAPTTFGQQRNRGDRVGRCSSHAGLAQGCANARMGDRLERPAFCGITEDVLTQHGAIKAAVSLQHAIAEMRGDLGQRGLARHHNLTRDNVGIGEEGAARAQAIRQR